MRSIGLDLGAKKISFCEVRQGEVVARRTVTKLEELEDVLGENSPPAKVAFEACREAWHVHDVLAAWGHEPLLLDTTRVKQLGIGQHGRKTDRIDAEVHARAVEKGSLPLAHVLTPERRQLRMALGTRRTLVEARAQFITTVRGIFRAHGQRVPSCAADHFLDHAAKMPRTEAVAALTDPLLVVLKHLDEQLVRSAVQLEQLCAHEPVVQVLTSAPSIGRITACAFIACIDGAGRFRNAHQVESYLGLVPLEDSSGGKQRLGAITKHGNGYVRTLLVESAWTIINHASNDPLAKWANGVAQRRNPFVAAVATARRLAGILWAMWRDGTYYDPVSLGNATAAGLRTEAELIAQRSEAIRRSAAKDKRERSRARNLLERRTQL